MSSLVCRRAMLQFFSATAACTLIGPLARNKLLGDASRALADGGNHLSFTPVRLPHPLPVYQQHPSYLATKPNAGRVLLASRNAQLSVASAMRTSPYAASPVHGWSPTWVMTAAADTPGSM